MTLKKFLDKFFFYISVPKCVSCGEILDSCDLPLCQSCYEEYCKVKTRNCSICAKTLNRCTCSNEYLESHYVRKLVKVYRYINDASLPSNKLIYSLKRENRKDVFDFLATELTDALLWQIKDFDNVIITNVPRRKAAIKKYGYDHAAQVAKTIAKQTGAKYIPLLVSKTEKVQKRLLKAERIKNANFAYKRKIPDLKNKNVIIVDDIVTTGASMGVCAALIRALKPKSIMGASVSVAYKDKYKKIDTSDRFGVIKTK